jgi:inhibitor of KinA
MIATSYTIFPLGDTAITIDFGNTINIELNKAVINLGELIKAGNFIGVTDIVPAYSSLTIHYDVIAVTKHYGSTSAYTIIKKKLEALLREEMQTVEKPARRLNIPVCYAAKYALDNDGICNLTNLSFDEVIRIHTSRIYRVYMVGFLPGFAYMGEVDPQIAVPRKREPKVTIAAGSVGIAGRQTGIYPLTSPGGWQIIGRTPIQLFDKEKEEPALFKGGDEVTFFSIKEDEFENY